MSFLAAPSVGARPPGLGSLPWLLATDSTAIAERAGELPEALGIPLVPESIRAAVRAPYIRELYREYIGAVEELYRDCRNCIGIG